MMFLLSNIIENCLCEMSIFEPHSIKEYKIHRGFSLWFQCYTIDLKKIGLNRVLQRGEHYYIGPCRLELPSNETEWVSSSDTKIISNV